VRAALRESPTGAERLPPAGLGLGRAKGSRSRGGEAGMKTLLHFKDIGEWTRAEKSVSARTVFFDISTCHFFAAGEPHALFTTSDLFTEEDCSLFDGFAASDMDALDHGHILRVPPVAPHRPALWTL